MEKGHVIRFLLAIALVLSTSSAMASENIIYEIDATLSRDDTGVLNDVTARYGEPSNFPETDTRYYVEVFSNDGTMLFRRNLEISFDLRVDPMPNTILPASLTERPAKEKLLYIVRVPYFPTASRIVFYHSSRNILDIDLGKELCDKDMRCELGENEYNCPSDCQKTRQYRYWDISSTTTNTQTSVENTLVPSTIAKKSPGVPDYALYLAALMITVLVIAWLGMKNKKRP